MAVVVTPIGIVANEIMGDGSGILLAAFTLAGIGAFGWLVKKKYAATTNESIQAVFILLTVAFILLTITGIWFRGRGMALMWPWAPAG